MIEIVDNSPFFIISYDTDGEVASYHHVIRGGELCVQKVLYNSAVSYIAKESLPAKIRIAYDGSIESFWEQIREIREECLRAEK